MTTPWASPPIPYRAGGSPESPLIASPGSELREVYPASGPERSESDGRILRAKALTDRAEHKLKAAVLLVGGGFAEEACAPAVEAGRLAVAALAAMRAKPEPGDAETAFEPPATDWNWLR